MYYKAHLSWILFVSLSVAILFSPLMVHGASVVWSKDIGNKSYDWPQPAKGMHVDLKNIEVSVTYNVEVKNAGTGALLSKTATVPSGTKLNFRFVNHVNSDIYWFGKGGIYDSPNGTWKDGAGQPNGMCSTGSNKVAGPNNGGYNAYAQYSVDPPSKSISGLGALNCTALANNGMTCIMDTAGTYAANFNFNGTPGKFWVGVTKGSGGCMVEDNDSVNVPTQKIAYAITVEPPPPENNPPTNPIVSSSGACVVGQLHTINMVSSDSDPGNQVQYQVDWDADGVMDQPVPASGYVNPGIVQTASRTYSVSGSKTVQVRAIDSVGAISNWSSTSFTCSDPQTPPPPPPPPAAAQCADGLDNDSDGLIDLSDADCTNSADASEFASQVPPPPPPPGPGPADISIRAVPSLVRNGFTTQVSWSSSNVDSCVANGNNGDAWSGLSSPVGGETSSPIRKRTVYTLSCIDLNGDSVSKNAVVNILPVWKEI